MLEFCRDREADVLRFTTDTGVWPTNNISESGLRPTKTQQKISGRLTSDDTTQDRLDIRSYIDTARKHGHDVLDRPARPVHRQPLDTPGSRPGLTRAPPCPKPVTHSTSNITHATRVNVYGWPVPAGVFPEEELTRLRGFPEIGREELFRFFTLTPADVAFVDPGRGRGPADRLGLAVTLCTLPWLGFVPDDVGAAPAVAVARLAGQLGVDPGVLRTTGGGPDPY